MSDRLEHWEKVYRTKGDDEVSWTEESPDRSLAILRRAGLSAADSVIDVGGGRSRLVDALAPQIAHVTVLDISPAALEESRNRLELHEHVDFLAIDITRYIPTRQFNFWHDRAVLHFLTELADQQAYVAALKAALCPGGVALIATFAPDGPEKCSGLPVVRHDAASLQELLGEEFQLVSTERHDHTTPWGGIQQFQTSMFSFGSAR